MAQDDPELRGRAFNFSYELPRTVLEIVQEILDVLGKTHLQPEIQSESPPPGEIPHQFLSAELARNHLNWTPKFGLRDGIALTYDWYSELFKTQQARQAARKLPHRL